MDRPLTHHIQPDKQPLSLKKYEKQGGYQAVQKALRDFDPVDLQNHVKEAGLKGRGGAGFNTGLKWSFVPMGDDAPRPKYLVANADEMEPGTFKDRLLMESNPHLFLEGIILSAYAIGAEKSYIFLRWAYHLSKKNLEKAIAGAYENNYLGENIQGSGFNLDLHIHISAGRYICGEETALLNALEGKRANPRAKPPFPQTSGLWGKPTIVQNVETLANVPGIVNNGINWYKDISNSEEDGGTKLYGVSGKVKNPGLWELPMGTTSREIIEEHAGGMQDGLKLNGWLPGGASTDFMVEEHLDVPMDYGSVMEIGSRLGTGTMIVLDDQTCPVGMIENLEHFFAQESCGWCTPCRDGLPWTEKILHAIEHGEGKMEDLDQLARHSKWLGPGKTYCALAPGAVEPLQSGLKYFREDFERHINEQRCPWS
ncbi:MAG: NADH-quinone oxidoreductase subunit F [Candidatus Marinimicrobia bacterium]|nr:NADH-quinone oxidoreductase subunit F [Candidatus Neomarinimicrobiota bacterium]